MSIPFHILLSKEKKSQEKKIKVNTKEISTNFDFTLENREKISQIYSNFII